ncbi:Uncharacterised protein [Enterobacter cloacae]|nr:Uncharacterised protein [Enterobacter cloacae]
MILTSLYDRARQAGSFSILLKHNHVVTVVTIGIVSQKHEVIADLTGDLPQPLPLLPVVPAV